MRDILIFFEKVSERPTHIRTIIMERDHMDEITEKVFNPWVINDIIEWNIDRTYHFQMKLAKFIKSRVDDMCWSNSEIHMESVIYTEETFTPKIIKAAFLKEFRS